MLLLALAPVALLAASGDAPPNVVWLIAEDLSARHLALYDDAGAETPHLRSLAENGVLYRHAFSNAPVCSVARTTLMTGCYAPRIGTHLHRKHVAVPLPDGLQMVPALLRDAGYYTTNRRKKDYNVIEGDGVWNESSKSATWRNRAAEQPFFHMQTFTGTHEGSLHFPAKDVSTEPTTTDPGAVQLPAYLPDTPLGRYTQARQYDRIGQWDKQLGSVLDQLSQDGLMDNTFIFVFSDHGGVLPRSKGYAYDSGLHVPLVVSIPARYKACVPWEAASSCDGFVQFADFAPTLLALAGVHPPAMMDGQPFLGRDLDPVVLLARQTSVGHANRFDEKMDHVRSLRMGPYRYVRSYAPTTFDGVLNEYRYRMGAYAEWRRLFLEGALDATRSAFFEPRPAELLFDLRSDPDEVNDLSQDPSHADVLLRARGLLQEQLDRWPDLGFLPEHVFLRDGSNAPVTYGRRQADRIRRLRATADLALGSWSDAETPLREALSADDPWERWWALFACAAHGDRALPCSDLIAPLASSDPERLVRARAIEWLATLGAIDDVADVFTRILVGCTDSTEVLCLLNRAVVLRDGPCRVDFAFGDDTFTPEVLKDARVVRRITDLTQARQR